MCSPLCSISMYKTLECENYRLFVDGLEVWVWRCCRFQKMPSKNLFHKITFLSEKYSMHCAGSAKIDKAPCLLNNWKNFEVSYAVNNFFNILWHNKQISMIKMYAWKLSKINISLANLSIYRVLLGTNFCIIGVSGSCSKYISSAKIRWWLKIRWVM